MIHIDTEIESEVISAIAAAKAAPFPALDWALGTNWSNSYAPVADGYFRDPQSAFQGGQKETKLEPF